MQHRKFGRIRKCQPSGRYQAAYTAPDGRLYKAERTFAAREDAEGWLTDRRREIDRELWSPPATTEQKKTAKQKSVKFGDYAEKWLETRTVKGRPLRRRSREGVRGPVRGLTSTRRSRTKLSATSPWSP